MCCCIAKRAASAKNKNILHNTKTIFKIIPQLYKTKTKTYLDTVKKIKHLHVSFLVGNFVPSWHQILIVLDGREAYFLLIISSFFIRMLQNLKIDRKWTITQWIQKQFLRLNANDHCNQTGEHALLVWGVLSSAILRFYISLRLRCQLCLISWLNRSFSF